GDLEEAFVLTMQAFNLTEKYQIPVIVLVDKYLMEGHATVDYTKMSTNATQFKIDRGNLLDSEALLSDKDYKRYSLTSDGVSPRSLPGQQGGIALSGSDEHDERGLYNEESEIRKAMMQKRFKKVEGILHDISRQEIIGDKDAELMLITFGSTKMPCLDALEYLRREGKKISLLSMTCVDPFPIEQIMPLLSLPAKKLVVEANFSGQLEALLREKTGFVPHDRMRKYDGRPFYAEEIVAKVKDTL
ncbi:MAG TPA: transketolase C-terminal domain-containing protein, partial [Patescibacteria group bacterium]|nr:transketolase C-terminal domain-containing protein [Patescibacteria group bacterium]